MFTKPVNSQWQSAAQISIYLNPNSKDHRANLGPIWGRQDPGGPQFGPMNFAIWEDICCLGYLPYHLPCTNDMMRNQILHIILITIIG